MTDLDLKNLRIAFAELAKSEEHFDRCVILIASSLSQLVFDAENWQMVFELLHWDWEGFGRECVRVELLDQLALALSPWKSETAKILSTQQASAAEWAEALQSAGISPMEALGLATLDMKSTVHSAEAGLS